MPEGNGKESDLGRGRTWTLTNLFPALKLALIFRVVMSCGNEPTLKSLYEPVTIFRLSVPGMGT